jgi:hypothetical protein
VSTYFIPRPASPDDARLATKRERFWSVIPEGGIGMDNIPVPMPLNMARVWVRETTFFTYSLAKLVRHATLDGAYWQWEPIDDPGGPLGLQRKREKGWRKPDGCVIVDRTSRWGNPFKAEDAIARGYAANRVEARRFVAQCFDDWLDGADWVGWRPELRERILREMPALRGMDLACACPVDMVPCHRDSYLRRANA